MVTQVSAGIGCSATSTHMHEMTHIVYGIYYQRIDLNLKALHCLTHGIAVKKEDAMSLAILLLN